AASVWAASRMWQLFGGVSGAAPALPDQALPFLMTTIVFFSANILLTSISTSLAHRVPLSGAVSMNLKWIVLNIVVAAAIGILIAGVYFSSLGMLGVYMLCLPVLLIRYSLQQYMNLKDQNV